MTVETTYWIPFSESWLIPLFDSMEDVLAAGYVITEEQITATSCFGMEAGYSAYKDANNKKYVVTYSIIAINVIIFVLETLA